MVEEKLQQKYSVSSRRNQPDMILALVSTLWIIRSILPDLHPRLWLLALIQGYRPLELLHATTPATPVT